MALIWLLDTPHSSTLKHHFPNLREHSSASLIMRLPVDQVWGCSWQQMCGGSSGVCVCVCALAPARACVCGLTAGRVRVGLKPCALCQGSTGAFFRIDELPAFLIKPSVICQQNNLHHHHYYPLPPNTPPPPPKKKEKAWEMRGGEVTCRKNLSSTVTSCTDVMCRSFDIYYQNIKN